MESLPRHRRRIRAASKPLMPCPADFIQETRQTRRVARDAVIGVVAPQFQPEHSVLLTNREVSKGETPAIDSPQRLSKSVSRRLPLVNQVTSTRLTPVVNDAK